MGKEAELLYLYVENSRFNIKNQEINFSSNYKISYDSEFGLSIKEIENDFNFGKSVKNINLLVGKNGVGKSSLLKLIGYGEANKQKALPRTSHIVLYKVLNDLYFIEGSNSLIKRILGYESFGNKNYCFFKYEKGNIKLVDRALDKNEQFSEISYQANIPNLEWVEDISLRKEKKNYPIKKNINPKVNFMDLIDFIHQHDKSSVKNVELSLKQKKRYSSNLTILYSIYDMTKENMYELLSAISTFKLLPGKLFSTEMNNSLKIIYFQNNIENEQKYSRKAQDRIYSRYTKEYFILRFLEKEVIGMLSKLPIGEKDDIKEIFDRIINERSEFEIDIEPNHLDDKNKFLLEILRYLNKKYPDKGSNFDEIEEFFTYYDSLDINKNLKTNNELIFDIKDEEDFKIVKELVSKYEIFFDQKIKQLSDGQLVYFNTYSKIYSTLNKRPQSIPLLLLLDEPDLNLHPEWSRVFIYDLIELINKSERMVQVIITTHSPFMVSDIPKERVYRITENGMIKNTKTSFAANIYDLLLDSFFLESSIGKFATYQLKERKSNKNNLLEIIDDPFLKNIMKDGKLK